MSQLDALRSGALAGAAALDLSGCGLTELPPEVFALAGSLEHLDLSGNRLADLPHGMGRLGRLKRLFCSGNPIARMPPALGACPALEQVGLRGCGLREVPAEALPPRLRWLTLTDNQLEHLPAALGEQPALQKLMLAGNRLRRLPDTMAGAGSLELLRVSANELPALPPWLMRLPRLAWLAWAGNPFERRPGTAPAASAIPWSHLRTGAVLGEGASGRVLEATWHHPGTAQPRAVAVKLFKGAMTSDGLPASEMAAAIAAGPHTHLVGALGFVTDHPAGGVGLVMPRVPDEWRVLAGPPDARSCSRDVYDPDWRLPLAAALRIAAGVGAAAAHLHARGLLHGDLYGHNILWDGGDGASRLSDFGAASFMPADDAEALVRLDVLAWGHLLGELLVRCAGDATSPGLHALHQACIDPNPAARPGLPDALRALAAAS